MKSTLIYYLGGVVAIAAIVGFFLHLRKRRPEDKTTDGVFDSNQTKSQSETQSFNIVRVDSLSYEWILNSVKDFIKSNEINDSLLTLRIVPQALAFEFFSTDNGSKIASVSSLSEEDIKSCAIVTLSSDNATYISNVVCFETLTDDFNDFVPVDKFYSKKIRIQA